VPARRIAWAQDHNCSESGEERKTGGTEGEMIEFRKHERRRFEERVEDSIEEMLRNRPLKLKF